MKNKLAIFGPYPPPLGGISVHLNRMEPFLQKEKIDYIIFNHGFIENKNVVATKKNLFWYLKLFFIKKHKVFHFHQFFSFHFIYYFFFSFFRKEKLIVTIHSERLLSYNKIAKTIILFFISKTKRLKLLSVSQNLNEFLKSKGIESIFLPAYVPPINVKEIKIRKSKEMFLFSVWKFNEKLANEIYNVPLAFEYLKHNKEKFTMLFMIGSKSDSDEKYLQQLIREYDIKESIKVVFNESLVDYLNNCQFLLRPNLSDGFGVSTQEAMDLGVPAIASDVCERPKGTILFKDNDLKDLSEKIEYAVNTPLKEIIARKENLNYHLTLVNIYKNSLKD